MASSGLGADTLGNSPLGNADWAKRVFSESISDFNKAVDDSEASYMQKMVASTEDAFDLLKQDITKLAELRDPFLARTEYNKKKIIRLGRSVKIPGERIQNGIDGIVLGSGYFFASSARFDNSHIGKTISFSKSQITSNNKTVTIVSIVDRNTVFVDGTLTTTNFKFRWELKDIDIEDPNNFYFQIDAGDLFEVGSGWEVNDGTSTLLVNKRDIYAKKASTTSKKQTDRELFDITIDTYGRIKSSSYDFTSSDIGKIIYLSGSLYSENNTRREIIGIEISGPDVVAIVSRFLIIGEETNGTIIYKSKDSSQEFYISHVASGINTVLSHSFENNKIIFYLATNNVGTVLTSASTLSSYINSSTELSNYILAEYSGDGLGIVSESEEFLPLPKALLTDTTVMYAAIMPKQTLQIKGAYIPKGVVEQFGNDGVILGNTFTSASANFSEADQNKILTIYSSTIINNRSFNVDTFNSKNQITHSQNLTEETGLRWELRTKTGLNDFSYLYINAPSILKHLAADFGLILDKQDTEIRQRNFIGNFNQWLNKKGSLSSYSIIGKVSGFDIEVYGLFSISRGLAISLASVTDVYKIGSSIASKSGTDGSITYDAVGDYIFTSPTADFSGTDLGTFILISGAATGTNNNFFTIKSIIDSNNVYLDSSEGMSSDLNNGTLVWAIIRLYVSQPPLLPNYDEINSDLMTSIVGDPEFIVDRFCYEDNFVTEIPLTINSVVFLSTNIVQVTATGQVAVVVAVGNWFIRDSANTIFYLESLPIETFAGSGIFTFQIFSSVLPTTGAGELGYACQTNVFCFYCPSYKILATIEANTINTDPAQAQSNSFNRVIKKLDYVKPIHVELVQKSIQNISVSFIMGVTVQTGLLDNLEILIPLGALYDIYSGDLVIPDTTGIGVEIETP